MDTYLNRSEEWRRHMNNVSWVPVFFDWIERPMEAPEETIDIECEVVETKQLEQ